MSIAEFELLCDKVRWGFYYSKYNIIMICIGKGPFSLKIRYLQCLVHAFHCVKLPQLWKENLYLNTLLEDGIVFLNNRACKRIQFCLVQC